MFLNDHTVDHEYLAWLESILPALLLQSLDVHRLRKGYPTVRLVGLGDRRVHPLWREDNVALDFCGNVRCLIGGCGRSLWH